MDEKENNKDIKYLAKPNESVVFGLQEPSKISSEWQKIFDHISDSIFIQDKNFTIIKANKATFDLLKLEEKDVVGKKCFQIFHKSDKPWKNCPFEKTKQDQKTHIEEIYDSNIGAHLLITTSPIFDEKGEFSGSVHIAKDITARKQFELSSQKKAADNQTIIDSVPAMVFYKDKENRFIRTNKIFEDEMNMPKEKLEGKSLFDIFPKEQAEAFWKDDLEVINSGRARRNIIEPMETSAGLRYVQTDKIPHFDENGNVIGIIGFAIDITERKKTEESLRQTTDYLENLFNYANAPIICWDKNFKITRFNPAFEKMTGYAAKETLGKYLDMLFPESTKKESLRKIESTLKEKWEVVEIPILRKDGQTRVALWNSANVYSKDGKNIEATIAQGQDITERKNNEEELEKLNRTLRAISNSNQLLMKATDELSYLDDVCKTIIEDCGYELVWIGYAENDEQKNIKPMASAGFEQGYLDTLNLTWADEERGRGPTGTAIRTGQISNCENMQTDPKFAPWRQEALKRGYKCSIVFPMKDGENTFGAISIYSKHQNSFSEKEIVLLKELASDVSYGIASLRTKKARFTAEEMLQKNEAKLQTEKNVLNTIMNNAQAGLAYIDRDFNFIAVNSAYCKNNGRNEEELLQKNYFDFFPSEENRLLFEKVRDAGQQIEFKQKPLVLKSQPWQDITYWDWTITPVKNNEGYVYGLVISLVDVSERVKSIENLKLHGHKLEQITSELKKVQLAVENASDIIFITDEKGRIIYINRAIKNILGHKQKELIGRKPNFWMDNMPNKFFNQMWRTIYFNKEPFVGEIQDRKKDGEIFTAEIRIAPVVDKNGQILSFVGIERDITEIKRLDAAKTEFISLAAHQLRTPITTVSLTAEMLLGGLSGKMNKESEMYLTEIMDGVKKMSEMIELFLNVSRIEMKTFEVMPQPSNVEKIIEENIKLVLPQIKNKGLELKKNISEDLPVITLDPKVMGIVLENLLSNAIKYTPSNGLIGVDAEKYRDSIIIKISDTGCGIPKKQQDKVFEKLYRADNTDKRIEGVGLGLYLCKNLIEQTGGKIWLTSEKDKGSTFYVSIPLTGMKKSKKATR